MGGCFSKVDEKKINSKKIDKEISKEMKKKRHEAKLLLLGAGESGKSTIIKQMRLIHEKKFSPTEMESYRVAIFNNTITSMKHLINGLAQFNIKLSNPHNQKWFRLFEDFEELLRNEPYPPDFHQAIKSLWSDRGIQESYQKGNFLPIAENCHIYFNDIDRIYEKGFSPTSQDILNTRIKTTGITETIFHMDSMIFRMVDVGGQRSERKKWIHCFEDVTALIFLAAISGYDQRLEEDAETNRMMEALMLFDSIINSPWFTNTSVILFLNKIDIFKRKIKYRPITNFFPDYQGDNQNFEQASQYFRKRFERLNRKRNQPMYTHFTWATDTNHVRNLMKSVSDIILSNNLKHLSLA